MTRLHRMALCGALVALIAFAPLAFARAETKPDPKAEKKTDAKHHKVHAKSEPKSEPKAERKAEKKSEKKAEKKPDKPADRHAANKKPHAEKKPAKVADAHDSHARRTRPHTLPGQDVATRSLEPPLAAPLAHAAPATAGIPLASAPTAETSASDIDAVRQAIGLARKGRTEEATAAARGISDPLARKLVEWVILRGDDNDVDFARYNAFIAANPGWPSIVTLRRRAEAMLWQQRASAATVRAYFANNKPLSPKGRFALARAAQRRR